MVFKWLSGKRNRTKMSRMLGKNVEITMDDGSVFRGVLQRADSVLPAGTKVEAHVGRGIVEGEVVETAKVPNYFFAVKTSDERLFFINSRRVKDVKEIS